MNENGKLLSVGSQIKNGGLDILACVDEFVGKPRLFDSLSVKIVFLRVEATAGTSVHPHTATYFMVTRCFIRFSHSS
jgi:hypothetical protein